MSATNSTISTTDSKPSKAQVRIKICGLRDPQNILAVSRLNPDYLGFIFYGHSPRYVGEHFSVPAEIGDSPRLVGVFVNSPMTEVVEKVFQHRLDLVQLHGEESASQCRVLRSEGIKVIKAISIATVQDLENASAYVGSVDYLLFDTKGSERGGNGFPFDWSILRNFEGEVPYFFGGGISPENIDKVPFDLPGLHAVDINSGVERVAGLKDVLKVKDIILKVGKECRMQGR